MDNLMQTLFIILIIIVVSYLIWHVWKFYKSQFSKKNNKSSFFNKRQAPVVWEVGSLRPYEKQMMGRWYPAQSLAHNTHTYSEDYLANVAAY